MLLGRATGATEAITLAKWLARRVVNPSQPSAAGYPPVFYAVALREYELTHILVCRRVRMPCVRDWQVSWLTIRAMLSGYPVERIRWLSAQ